MKVYKEEHVLNSCKYLFGLKSWKLWWKREINFAIYLYFIIPHSKSTMGQGKINKNGNYLSVWYEYWTLFGFTYEVKNRLPFIFYWRNFSGVTKARVMPFISTRLIAKKLYCWIIGSSIRMYRGVTFFNCCPESVSFQSLCLYWLSLREAISVTKRSKPNF